MLASQAGLLGCGELWWWGLLEVIEIGLLVRTNVLLIGCFTSQQGCVKKVQTNAGYEALLLRVFTKLRCSRVGFSVDVAIGRQIRRHLIENNLLCSSQMMKTVHYE